MSDNDRAPSATGLTELNIIQSGSRDSGRAAIHVAMPDVIYLGATS